MAEPTVVDVVVAIGGLLVVCLVVFIGSIYFYKKVLRPFTRALSARRARAKSLFYHNRFPFNTHVLNKHFEGWEGVREWCAILILFCLYRSWLYRGILMLVYDVQNNIIDILKIAFSIQVVKTPGVPEEKHSNKENTEKSGKIICEYAKTCEERYSCTFSTPSQNNPGRDRREPCSHLHRIIELVGYNPKAGAQYVRCAAAAIGKCVFNGCTHFGPHEFQENCMFPSMKGECIARVSRDDDYYRFDRKNMVRCIISDCAVDLNLSFKRTKQ